jgi:hypothetical protein
LAPIRPVIPYEYNGLNRRRLRHFSMSANIALCSVDPWRT